MINPIITENRTNMNVRKLHNDKFDSKKAAMVGLKLNGELKVSFPAYLKVFSKVTTQS